MENRVHVSICIPTYQEYDLVKRLLDSIAMQTYKDYEVIISDDSEDDSIGTLLGGYSFENAVYVRHKSKRKASENWNNTIRYAHGDYIKMMFQDDFFSEENSLKKMVEGIETSEAELYFCGCYLVSEKDVRERRISKEQRVLLQKDIRNIYLGNYIGAPSVTIWKNQEDFFDERLTWIVDMEIYYRILLKNSKIAFTDELLVSIGIHEEQLTNRCEHDYKLVKDEYGYFLKKHRLYKTAYIYEYMKMVKHYCGQLLRKIGKKC